MTMRLSPGLFNAPFMVLERHPVANIGIAE